MCSKCWLKKAMQCRPVMCWCVSMAPCCRRSWPRPRLLWRQAQANYELAAKGLSDEQRALAMASAEMELTNAQQALQALYDQPRSG